LPISEKEELEYNRETIRELLARYVELGNYRRAAGVVEYEEARR
jgi:hypothetical protein